MFITRKEKKKETKRSKKIIKSLRLNAYYKQNGLCYYCKVELKLDCKENDPQKCTAEHLIAITDGGEHSKENIVAACYDCNHNRSKTNPRHKAHNLIQSIELSNKKNCAIGKALILELGRDKLEEILYDYYFENEYGFKREEKQCGPVA